MLLWECRRRLAQLIEFRKLAVEYFSNVEYPSWMSDEAPLRLNQKAQLARHQINRMMHDLADSFDLIGISRVVTYTPPPRFGGHIQQVDTLGNMFDLRQFELEHIVIFDLIDRAIGAYERECQRLGRKLFNPLYWLGILFVWFLRLPFRFLSAAGFNGARIEGSFFGKVVKLALGLIPLTAAALKIADDWDKVRALLHSCLLAFRRYI